MKLYLQRKDENVKKNQALGEEKYPYFTLSMPPEIEGGVWKEVAAFWKSKSGKGYNGKIKDGVSIHFADTTLSKQDIHTIKALREQESTNVPTSD